MKYRTSEIIVGIVSLVALVILVGVTINLKKSTIFSRKYPIAAYFKDVKRLEEGASVYVHGVVRGDVRRIEATGRKDYPVRVVMMLTTGTLLHQGALPRIVSAGLVGETEINIEDTSPSAPLLPPGSEIYGESFKDINDLLAQAPGVLEDIQASVAGIRDIIANEKNKQAVSNILESASSITMKINRALGESSTDIRETLRNLRIATERLDHLLAHVDSIVTTVGTNLTGASDNLNSAISDLRTSASDVMGRLDRAALQIDEAAAKADLLLTTASAIIAENREDARRAVAALTSASVHLGNILAKIDKGESTLAQVLLGRESYIDLSRSLGNLEESLAILNRWLEGLDRWLSGSKERRALLEIPYEGVSTGTKRSER